MKLAALILLLPVAALAASDSLLPDPARTPGVMNPAVTQANLQKTICVPNWTKTVRPPASYTDKLKLQQMKDLGLKGDPHSFEEDHFVSIEMGGDPRDPKNLWPQPWPDARHKDVIENQIHRKLCAGQMRLEDVPDAIRHWPQLYAEHERKSKTGAK